PNYLALVSGQTWGCDGYDGIPNSNNCTGQAWNSTDANLVDRLEAKGITWKAYMEDMPSNCYTNDTADYTARHNPFVYFKDIVDNQTRCDKIVPAGANDITLLQDLNSTKTASNFMWLTPNMCNDMHDCSVSVGDKYLSELVPKILASNVFMTQKAVIFLVFDEPGSGGSSMYAAWVGPAAKKAYQSAKSYTQYSFLKTVEANWGLPNITSNDGNALAMTEFFGDNHNYEVTVSNKQLVDSSRTETTLIGINYGDHPGVFRSNDPATDAQKISDAGFKQVLLLKEWGALENSKNSSTFSYNDTEFQKMMLQIGNLTQKGINVIVKLSADYDTPRNGQNLYSFLGSQYCNSPGNYSSSFSEDFYNTSYIGDSTSAQSHLIRLWMKISQMTRNNPRVIGLNILNEPTYCEYKYELGARIHDSWHDRVSEIIQSLRNDGEQRMILVDEAPFFEYYEKFTPWSDPKVISSIHWYRGVHDHTEIGSYSACWSDYQTLSNLWSNVSMPGGGGCTNESTQIKQAQDKYPNQLFMVTEFGDIYGNIPGDANETWIKNSIQLFKDNGITGWFYWSSKDTGTWIKDMRDTAPFGAMKSNNTITFVSNLLTGETTNLNILSNLGNASSVILQAPKLGKIAFLQPINFTKFMDMNDYQLQWQGYNYNLANKTVININGQNITSLPASDTTANNNTWKQFSLDISKHVKPGSNTLSFIRNYGYSKVSNVTVLRSGQAIYSNSSQLELWSNGTKVAYAFTADPTYTLDLDNYVSITPLRIEVKTDMLPFMDKPAKLVFEQVSLDNPMILRNGDACDTCVLEIYNKTSGTLVFRVPGFSVYTLQETPSAPAPAPASSGGSGGRGGGGSYVIIPQQTTTTSQTSVTTQTTSTTTPVVTPSITTTTTTQAPAQGISGMQALVAAITNPWVIASMVVAIAIVIAAAAYSLKPEWFNERRAE
ncbi:hypothetical protein EPN87_00925, partial [archaeon]